jgi:hypothetical protein
MHFSTRINSIRQYTVVGPRPLTNGLYLALECILRVIDESKHSTSTCSAKLAPSFVSGGQASPLIQVIVTSYFDPLFQTVVIHRFVIERKVAQCCRQSMYESARLHLR